MKRNLIITGLVLLFLFSQSLFAQQNLKNSDAVFLEINKVYTLKPDGSVHFEYSHKVKLLTYYAVNRYLGETFIAYNPKFQKLKIDKSVTTMADGTLVPSPKNAFNEILPRFVSRAPAYAYLRQMVVSHTGLERGCIIDLKYHIDTEAKFLPWLMGEETFGTKSPIEKMTVKVNVPQGMSLKYHMFNSSLKPAVTEEKGYTHYVWTMKNCPMLRPEPNHQSFDEFAPRLIFSSSGSWDEIDSLLAKRTENKYQLTEKAINCLLGKTYLDTSREILTIQKSVAEQIGNVYIDLSLLGFRCSSAEATFNHNYGTNLDKAILLKALLDAKGLDAKVALVSSNRQFDNTVSSLAQFSTACVIVKNRRKGPIILLPDKPQKNRGTIELAGKTLLILGSSKPILKQIPALIPQKEFVRLKADLKIDKNLQMTGNLLVKTGGYFYPAFDLWENESQQRFIQNIVSTFFGKNIVIEDYTARSLNFENSTFSAKITIKDIFQKIGKTNIFAFSGIGTLFDSYHVSAALNQRFTPLELPSPLQEEIQLTVTLPKEFSFIFVPKSFDLINDCGKLSWHWEEKNNKLVMNRSLVFQKKTILPSIYPKFRELVVNLEAKDNKRFFIK